MCEVGQNKTQHAKVQACKGDLPHQNYLHVDAICIENGPSFLLFKSACIILIIISPDVTRFLLLPRCTCTMNKSCRAASGPAWWMPSLMWPSVLMIRYSPLSLVITTKVCQVINKGEFLSNFPITNAEIVIVMIQITCIPFCSLY